jgi:putative membrane protein
MIAAPLERKERTAMMSGYGWGGGMMLLLGGCVLLGIVLLVVLAWTLMRWKSHTTPISLPRHSDMPGSASPALNILRQRYAGGEMDTATYEQRRERLDRPSQRQPTQRT